MARIVTLGSLNMDLVAVVPHLPLAGETLIGTDYLNEPGGKGANQAYAAAKLGGDVAMLGRVGTDDHGKRMVANLAAVGCDVTGVRIVDGPSGVAMIFVAQSGQNCIAVIAGANQRYLSADLRADDQALATAQIVLLQLETPVQTVVEAARMARRHGGRVILDPAPAPRAFAAELLQYIDILTPNETEAAQLVGEIPGVLSPEAARSIAKKLQAAGARAVIVKMGAQGCLLAEGDSAISIEAPQVKAVDTTAAGDVFNGALAVACSQGASLADACRFAVRAAAISVTRLGAQRSMPGREELAPVALPPR